MIVDRDSYWELVNRQWDNIMSMAVDQLDLNSPAFDDPGNPQTKMTGRSVLNEMHFLKRIRSTKLPRYFNAIWGLASESYAYSKPGWSTLCDLCSEEYVLWPDGPEES